LDRKNGKFTQEITMASIVQGSTFQYISNNVGKMSVQL